MAQVNEGPLARILKLLDTGESLASSNPKLAESYREKAYALASQATIDAAVIRWSREHGETGSAPEETIDKQFSVGRPFIPQLVLANIVYREFGLKLVQLTGCKGRAHVFGFRSDMERADMMFVSLAVQCTREAVRGYREYVEKFEPWECPECEDTEWRAIPRDEGWYYCLSCRTEFYSSRPPASKPERRPTWVRSFWYGWIEVVSTRLAKQMSAAKQTADASSMTKRGAEVALRGRDEAVQQAVDARYEKLRTARGRIGSGGSGRSAGKEAGSRADLGTGKVGATRREVR